MHGVRTSTVAQCTNALIRKGPDAFISKNTTMFDSKCTIEHETHTRTHASHTHGTHARAHTRAQIEPFQSHPGANQTQTAQQRQVRQDVSELDAIINRHARSFA